MQMILEITLILNLLASHHLPNLVSGLPRVKGQLVFHILSKELSPTLLPGARIFELWNVKYICQLCQVILCRQFQVGWLGKGTNSC